MKNQELFKVLLDDKVLSKNLTTEEYCELMEDLSQQFYENKLPKPLNLITQIQNEYEEE